MLATLECWVVAIKLGKTKALNREVAAHWAVT